MPWFGQEDEYHHWRYRLYRQQTDFLIARLLWQAKWWILAALFLAGCAGFVLALHPADAAATATATPSQSAPGVLFDPGGLTRLQGQLEAWWVQLRPFALLGSFGACVVAFFLRYVGAKKLSRDIAAVAVGVIFLVLFGAPLYNWVQAATNARLHP